MFKKTKIYKGEKGRPGSPADVCYCSGEKRKEKRRKIIGRKRNSWQPLRPVCVSLIVSATRTCRRRPGVLYMAVSYSAGPTITSKGTHTLFDGRPARYDYFISHLINSKRIILFPFFGGWANSFFVCCRCHDGRLFTAGRDGSQWRTEINGHRGNGSLPLPSRTLSEVPLDQSCHLNKNQLRQQHQQQQQFAETAAKKFKLNKN